MVEFTEEEVNFVKQKTSNIQDDIRVQLAQKIEYWSYCLTSLQMCTMLVDYDYEKCHNEARLAVMQFIRDHPETIPLFVDRIMQKTLAFHNIMYLGINEILGCEEKDEDDGTYMACAKVWLNQQIMHQNLRKLH